MDPIDYWKLCSELSIVQATLLICGSCPDDLQYEVENSTRRRPAGYVGIRTALCNAIQSKTLKAAVVIDEQNDDGSGTALSLHGTLIRGHDVNLFLKSKNMTSDFFEAYAIANVSPGAVDQQFPIKLNAAIKAWTAVTNDPKLLRGRSPKQALERWLTENAADLGLVSKKGKLNMTGIQEIAKVANWKPEGGATPTHSSEVLPAPTSLVRLPSRSEAGGVSIFGPDDEIPF